MLAEVVAELTALAGLVDERCAKRQLLIQVLRDADLLQHLGQLIAAVVALLLIAIRRDLSAPGSATARTQQGGSQLPPSQDRSDCPVLYQFPMAL